MPQSKISPDSFSFNTAISACEKVGEVFRARRLLVQMQKHMCQKEVLAYNSIISAAQKGRQWELALETLADMHSSLVAADEISYSGAIAACHHCARWEQALDLFGAMKLAGLTQGPAACNATIIALQAGSQWRAALHCVKVAPVADLTVVRPTLDASGRSGLAHLLEYTARELTKQLSFELNLRSVGLQRGVRRPPLLQQGRLQQGGLPPGADVYVAGASLELVAAAAETLDSHFSHSISEGLSRSLHRGVVTPVRMVLLGIRGICCSEQTVNVRTSEGKPLRNEVLRKCASLGASFLKALLCNMLQAPTDIGEPLRAHFLSHMCAQECQSDSDGAELRTKSGHSPDPRGDRGDRAWFRPVKPVPAAAHLITVALVHLQTRRSRMITSDLILCSGLSRRTAPREDLQQSWYSQLLLKNAEG